MLHNICGAMNMILTNDANCRCETVARNILKGFCFC